MSPALRQGTEGTGKLPEVQGLRAIAVTGVVAFHFWPSILPGGFVGVDVFYVISGFLITGLILRSLERGRFSFADFYRRRARRLLPAATLVLAVTTVAVLALPVTIWLSTLQEVLASLFYVENWVLGLEGSDYFGGESTAVQHYWSLSVEEQFYLAWPAALAGLWWWQRRSPDEGGVRRRMLLGLAVASAISLVLSITMTRSNPTLAFYATHTRIWEFGAGAALALLPRWQTRPALRGATAWAGLIGLLVAMLVITPASPFPGWIALLPVVSTAAVIAGGSPGLRWTPDPLLRVPVVQWLGDTSYSLYLWHWPPLVLLPVVTGDRLSWQARVLLLLLVLALAWATKVHVEDRFRVHAPSSPLGSTEDRSTAPRRRGRPTGIAGIVGSVALVAVVAGAGLLVVDTRATRAEALERQAVADGVTCFGAAALDDPGCEPPLGDTVVPDPAVAFQQFRYSPERDCLVEPRADEVIVCEYGDPDANVHIALLGDSHALSWLPALQLLVEQRDWRVSTYMRGSCPANPAELVWFDDYQAQLCARWAGSVIEQVQDDESIDMVIATASYTYEWQPVDGLSGFETGVAGYASTWSAFADAGVQVLALADTPRLADNVLQCVADDPSSCGQPRDEVTDAEALIGEPTFPTTAAVASVGRAEVVLADPINQVCGPQTCEAVVGNAVVFVDGSHLSQTYARTLAPFLETQIARVLL